MLKQVWISKILLCNSYRLTLMVSVLAACQSCQMRNSSACSTRLMGGNSLRKRRKIQKLACVTLQGGELLHGGMGHQICFTSVIAPKTLTGQDKRMPVKWASPSAYISVVKPALDRTVSSAGGFFWWARSRYRWLTVTVLNLISVLQVLHKLVSVHCKKNVRIWQDCSEQPSYGINGGLN